MGLVGKRARYGTTIDNDLLRVLSAVQILILIQYD